MAETGYRWVFPTGDSSCLMELRWVGVAGDKPGVRVPMRYAVLKRIDSFSFLLTREKLADVWHLHHKK